MAMKLKSELKNAYSLICKKLSKENPSPWLRDNFYIIHKHYQMLLKEKELSRFGDLYGVIEKYCRMNEYIADEESLSEYLSSLSKDFGYFELCKIKPMLSACGIIAIRDSLLGKGKGIELLPAAIKLLISLADPKFDLVLPKAWKPERSLEGLKEFSQSDEETKSQYRKYIAEYAKRYSLSEEMALKRLAQAATASNKPLGSFVFAPKEKYAFAWWALNIAVFALLFAISFMFIGMLSLVLVVPFGLAASSVADQLTSMFISGLRAPRLEIEAVPHNAKTLVAIATLMQGNEGDFEAFESLERFSCMNPDENIYFCILADFADSDIRYHSKDEEIIQNAKKRIDSLNNVYGQRFCLYFRERVMNKSEKRYGGWERKRGAVCQLIKQISQGGSTEYYGPDFIRDIKYLLTLDSDTNLSVGTVRELVSIALHPANQPKIENSRVVSGFGIIQPSLRTELKSAYKTAFSRLISGAGGSDIYANAEFKRSQAIFGSGNFCGKGLIDVSVFDTLVNGKLPEGLVLSHDFIEGSITRTLCASDIVLTDSTPGNTVSFYRRQHRWMRGDFQNLYFLKGNLLQPFGKIRLVASVLRHSSPLFSLLAIIIGCFLNNTNGLALFLLAYSEFFLPCIISLLRFLFNGSPFACRRFFSKTLSILSQSFMVLFFELSAGCRKALLVLNAYTLSAVRLVTRKKTLEWTTAAQTEKLSSNLGKYVLDSSLSALIGLVILAFAKPPFIRLCGVFYFVYPLLSANLSASLGGGELSKPKLSEKQKKLLSAHISSMLGFYLENVNENTNYLPPDNIQLSPVTSIAYRTSPTNIGFYLVSVLAARDMGAISSNQLYSLLDSSLNTIEKLDKYKGNLYNWYDIKTLSVLGERYVSAVDCGNFLVMLVALKQGLSDYAQLSPELSDIVCRCEKLINDADIKALYDEKRGLFPIGFNQSTEKFDNGYYDLLISEARMLAYYAVASNKVPKKHWRSLGRTLTHKQGYMGLMSWSGTAFEYLMPQLFLPLYRDSFLYESVAFSVMVQKSESKPWGISESGYYAFDSDMNYQYKANGIQTLALRRIGTNEKVISPYSTYLSLCVCGNSAIKNLEALDNRGMFGKYGLYEALDMNEGLGGICVKSYMAHHVGMSIIACMNAINDNIFVRRFLSDKQMGAAKELLMEKIPIESHIFENSKDVLKKPSAKSKKSDISEDDLQDHPKPTLLSRGDMTAVVSSLGHIGLYCGDKMLSHTDYSLDSLEFSLNLVFSRGGQSFGCARLYGNELKYSFQQGEEYASHIASGKDFTGRVRYSFSKNSNCFIINTKAEALKRYDITLSFLPVLEQKKKYLSHISFSRLFIESEYDQKQKILYFHRRSNIDGHYIFSMAVALNENIPFSFQTTRETLPAASVISPFDYASMEADNKWGACIDPLCLLRVNHADGGRATFLLTCGSNKSECERNIKIARREAGEYASNKTNPNLQGLLASILYNNRGHFVESFSHCTIGDLWGKKISCDYPLAVVIAKKNEKRVLDIINSFLVLSKACLRSELIFIVEDDEDAHWIRDQIYSLGAKEYIDRNGGIFILAKNQLTSDLFNALKSNSHYFSDLSQDIAYTLPLKYNPRNIIASPQNAYPLPVPKDAVPSAYGYFVQNGFVVDKSNMPLAPYSYVLSGYRFSCVLNQSSLGYTFFDNARERRLCSFYGDSRSLENGERIFLILNGKEYDLCAVSNKVSFEKGKTVYYGNIEDIEYTLTVVVPPKYPVKLIRIQYEKNEKNLETRFQIKAVMGDSITPVRSVQQMHFSSGNNDCIMLKNTFGMTYPEGYGFLGVCGGKGDKDECCVSSYEKDIIFFLGACATELGAKEIASRINKGFFEICLEDAFKFADSLIPKIQFETHREPLNRILNYFIPYQISACRFYARGSFYQSGGAYGFRDQLQDCLSVIYSSPKTVRTHLIRCCAHQYLDGTVMHWWHTRNFKKVNRGIKSQCSDDLLYLPLVTADYIEKTGDKSLLSVSVEYLDSPPLGSLSERYEQPERSGKFESVYHHCLRALNAAYKIGKHGLVLMGSCDWNDAFSLVGEKGVGESVFSSLLYIISAQSFIPIIESRGDMQTAKVLNENIQSLKKALEENAFYKDRYARAICDDQTVLGIEGCGECEIDILSQAFASIAGLDRERARLGLQTAFSKLYERETGIFKLFSPPFNKGRCRVGYIRGYVSGIRENGGQYTHGALWGALGCINAGMYDEALKIMDCADPSLHCEKKEKARIYKNEPYALSADIYSGDFSGRGGWSWYTGAAAWFYRIMLEYVAGIKLGSGGTILSADPIKAIKLCFDLPFGKLHIIASEEIKQPLLNGETVKFPLKIPDGESVLELPVKK